MLKITKKIFVADTFFRQLFLKIADNLIGNTEKTLKGKIMVNGIENPAGSFAPIVEDFFEGLTVDYLNHLADRIPDPIMRQEVKKSFDSYVRVEVLQGSQPDRLDPGDETVYAARKYIEIQTAYPALFRLGITPQDVDAYEADYEREEVLKELRILEVRHPFVKAYESIPTNEFAELRGLPAFFDLSDVLVEKTPEIKMRRSLNVLYPGSGKHIAPLITALRLIDEKIIDQAEFVYTEINGRAFEKLVELLSRGEDAGLFKATPDKKPKTFCGEEGSEQTIRITYKGRNITLIFALNRSGKDYYRPEYLSRADLVVIHDPAEGHLESSFKLLSKMIFDYRSNPSGRNQLVIMEGGTKHPEFDGSADLPSNLASTELPGPYGHCGGPVSPAETRVCKYISARTFHLNAPALLRMADTFQTPDDLSSHLLQPARSPVLGAPTLPDF